MSVKVLSGRKLEKDQAKLTRMMQIQELDQRCLGVNSRVYDQFAFYEYLKYRNIACSSRWCRFEDRYAANDWARKHPDAAMAIIDVVEGIKDIAVWQARLHVRGSILQFLYGAKPFELLVKFVTSEAYHVAAEAEKVVERIKMSYDRHVMRRVAIRVEVVEKPLYISPREGLKALGG